MINRDDVLAAEHGAATAYAALASGAYQPAEGERVAVIVCAPTLRRRPWAADRHPSLPGLAHTPTCLHTARAVTSPTEDP